jgi:hypothetical protein
MRHTSNYILAAIITISLALPKLLYYHCKSKIKQSTCIHGGNALNIDYHLDRPLRNHWDHSSSFWTLISTPNSKLLQGRIHLSPGKIPSGIRKILSFLVPYKFYRQFRAHRISPLSHISIAIYVNILLKSQNRF